jgi:hypothetical protein
VVTSEYSVSPSKSLQLWGNPNWASVVLKPFSLSSNLIGYEAAVLISAIGSGGPTRYEWLGFSSEDTTVHFNHETMNILAGDESILGTWTPGLWYNVKVVLDRSANRYSVWINGELKGSSFVVLSQDVSLRNSMVLASNHPGVKVYYDDVRVFEGDGSTPSPSASPTPSSNSPSPNQTNTSGASTTPAAQGDSASSNLPLIVGIVAAITVPLLGVALFVYRKKGNKPEAKAEPTEIPPPLPLQFTSLIFISHVEEDADVALEIAHGLEDAGYKTWFYERDNIPGFSYLLQTKQAIEQSQAIILIISPNSLGSSQITKEVIRGHEADKPFVPVLRGIKHVEFQRRQPEWQEALGSASSIEVGKQKIATLLPRIIEGLAKLGVKKAEQPTGPT